MMLIVMFSMAGIPVFVGFFAKFAVLKAVVNAGMIWLAVFAVVCALIGAFYYLRVVKVMYFDAPESVAPHPGQPRSARAALRQLPAVAGIEPDAGTPAFRPGGSGARVDVAVVMDPYGHPPAISRKKFHAATHHTQLNGSECHD